MKTRAVCYIMLFLVASSCSPMMGIYGIHAPKEISEKKIYKYGSRLKIPHHEIYELDTSYYSYVLSLGIRGQDSLSSEAWSEEQKKRKNQIKNHYQPLQALYFDKSGQLVSFQINCYAGGFPNLEWERDSIMTCFPPKIQAPLDTLISDAILLKYMVPLSKSMKVSIREHDYLVFVLWSKFMGRQNKRFIRSIQENYKIASEKNVKFVYINTDNFFKGIDIW
ncbi:MAG: hypothetical protein EP338_03055 [Bacteroidetes bacterium]|nr:MAG: hypothetical protein EP338_03055 [Bacteroidota bacterium]